MEKARKTEVPFAQYYSPKIQRIYFFQFRIKQYFPIGNIRNNFFGILIYDVPMQTSFNRSQLQSILLSQQTHIHANVSKAIPNSIVRHYCQNHLVDCR